MMALMVSGAGRSAKELFFDSGDDITSKGRGEEI
jgi:hypothetical protein